MRTILIIAMAAASVACNSSKSAPKPFTSTSDKSPQQIQQMERDAEAKQPCSEQNLKNATEEQRRRCDPTQGMFDSGRNSNFSTANKPSHPKKHTTN